MSRVISKLRRVAYIRRSHVSLSSNPHIFSRPLSTSSRRYRPYCGTETVITSRKKKQESENARTLCNEKEKMKTNEHKGPRSRAEADILKAFCVEKKGPSRKEQQRIEKCLGREIVASSCMAKAARRAKQRNHDNYRSRKRLRRSRRSIIGTTTGGNEPDSEWFNETSAVYYASQRQSLACAAGRNHWWIKQVLLGRSQKKKEKVHPSECADRLWDERGRNWANGSVQFHAMTTKSPS